MPRAPFHFKQFSILAHDAGMAVSTDGVMLGAWSDLETANTILDIGTGTGLLALMAAQRNERAHITAIDIESSAIASAKINIGHSLWRERITLEQHDILEWSSNQTFEHIVCNPPYFTSGQQAQADARAIARHTSKLSQQLLAHRVSQLLAKDGKASFVLPIVEGEQFIARLAECNLGVSRLTRVKTTYRKSPSRLLIEACNHPDFMEEQELVISEGGHYSADFAALTGAFYLKLSN